MSQESKEDQYHCLTLQDKKAVRVYTYIATKDIPAKTNEWVSIPGLHQVVEITDDESDVIIHAHSHMYCESKAARADLGIFVDGLQCGTVSSSGWHGTALSHVDSWVPAVSLAKATLRKGAHSMHVALRNNANNNQEVRSHTATMIVQIFQTIPVWKWCAIDINDTTTFFNKELEYRLEIKGSSMVYPVMVQKDKIWFINCQNEQNIESGFACVEYKNKRTVNDQYIVTKIEARTSK